MSERAAVDSEMEEHFISISILCCYSFHLNVVCTRPWECGTVISTSLHPYERDSRQTLHVNQRLVLLPISFDRRGVLDRRS